VIRRAFVGELPAPGQRIVNDEAALVGEDDAQNARGCRGLDGSVEHLLEVGGRQMDATVGCIRRWRHGRRVRHPHGRRARARAQREPVSGGRGGDDLFVGPVETEPAQRGEAGAIVRRQHRLGDSQIAHEAHLCEALLRRGARIRDLPRVGRAGDVPGAQPGVIVCRSDQAVELDLGHREERSAPWGRGTAIRRR
jgi:hypothetical protein